MAEVALAEAPQGAYDFFGDSIPILNLDAPATGFPCQDARNIVATQLNNRWTIAVCYAFIFDRYTYQQLRVS